MAIAAQTSTLWALALWARMIWWSTSPRATTSPGDARDVRRHGTLRNQDRPDQLLDQAAADKIRNYREPAPIGRWRLCPRACRPRGAFTASWLGDWYVSTVGERTSAQTLALEEKREGER